MAVYTCVKCGYGSALWYGKCPSCEEWNTFEHSAETRTKTRKGKSAPARVDTLSKISSQSNMRVATGNQEFDRVLGGGFVGGEVLLLAGEPGVGKSTLLLSVLENLPSFYISGEESGQQVKQRADRLGVNTSHILFSKEMGGDAIFLAF